MGDNKLPPRLLRSPLTGRVYVATRYRERPSKTPGKTVLVVSVKHDVTDDFNEIVADFGGSVSPDSRTAPNRQKEPKLGTS